MMLAVTFLLTYSCLFSFVRNVEAGIFERSLFVLQSPGKPGFEIPQDNQTDRIPVLVLDVDGTLYDDDCNIEQQIRDNFHEFALQRFGIEIEDCERMHVQYGSGIRGLAEEITGSRDVFADYYNNVYPNLDMSKLRKYLLLRRIADNLTGYRFEEIRRAHTALLSIKSPIVIASNSPVFHIKRIINRLGLKGLKVQAYLTPERRAGLTKCEPAFWTPLLQLYPKDKYICTLIDDNRLNIDLCRSLGMNGICVAAESHLDSAVAAFLCNPNCPTPFQLDENHYLIAKNKVDQLSINTPTLQKMVSSLFALQKPALRVLDLGAGRLNMLDTVLEQVAEMNSISSHLIRHIEYIALESNLRLYPGIIEHMMSLNLTEVRNTAYLNHTLLQFEGTIQGMHITLYISDMSFMDEEAPRVLNNLFYYDMRHDQQQHAELVKNRSCSPQPGMFPQFGYDLMIAACVADLHHPQEFITQVIEFAAEQGGVLYMPVTFQGVTRFARSRPSPVKDQAIAKRDDGAMLRRIKKLLGFLIGAEFDAPSVQQVKVLSEEESQEVDALIADSTILFGLYHQYLQNKGHHLSISKLVEAIESTGAVVEESAAPSHWHIHPNQHSYLWQCLMWFIVKGAGLDAHRSGIDLANWYQRVNSYLDHIELEVENVDLLVKLPVTRQFIRPNHTACHHHGVKPQSNKDDQSLGFDSSTGLVSIPRSKLSSRLPLDEVKGNPEEDLDFLYAVREDHEVIEFDALGYVFANHHTEEELGSIPLDHELVLSAHVEEAETHAVTREECASCGSVEGLQTSLAEQLKEIQTPIDSEVPANLCTAATQEDRPSAFGSTAIEDADLGLVSENDAASEELSAVAHESAGVGAVRAENDTIVSDIVVGPPPELHVEAVLDSLAIIMPDDRIEGDAAAEAIAMPIEEEIEKEEEDVAEDPLFNMVTARDGEFIRTKTIEVLADAALPIASSNFAEHLSCM
jgi:FMN phosphatase YigB (HAD superfamily)